MIRPVEEGGMGVVWMARQLSLGRTVALKTYKPRGGASEASRGQFVRSAQLAARLQHPHIVSIYTAGIEGDTLYYVMEFVEGVTLERVLAALSSFLWQAEDRGLAQLPEDLLRAMRLPDAGKSSSDSSGGWSRGGRIQPLRRALAFLVEAFLPVVQAIDYAHRQGIVHGDIKPANLMFDRTGRLLVLDFGLARTISMLEGESPGAPAGTARYLSPEQIAGLPGGISTSIDVYALGATLYEVLTLKPAYDGATREHILAKIATENPKPVREINPRVHRDLGLIVERSMRRQPRRRYPTAVAMAQDLQKFLRRQPLTSAGTAFVAHGRRIVHDRPLLALVAVVVLALGLGFGVERAIAAVDRGGDHARVLGLLDDVRSATAAARQQYSAMTTVNGGDGAGLHQVEADLERAAESLVRARSLGVETDAVKQQGARFERESVEIRIRAYVAAGQEEIAYQLLRDAAQVHDLSPLEAELAAQGRLGAIVVSCPTALGVTAAVRRVDPITSATTEDVVEGQLPAAFENLFPGRYVVELRQAGHADIRFPLQVRAAVRLRATVPYAPADVPADMVYVGCHDREEFVVGDYLTRHSIGTYGPQRKTLYRSYFIDRFEVTNAEFARFYESSDFVSTVVETVQKDDPDVEVPTDPEVVKVMSPIGWTMGRYERGTENQPVQLRQWFLAAAFARWRGKELPTEDEWEKAARGISGRLYPYGNVFVLENHYSPSLLEVGSRPKDESVYGVRDMLGSVSELTLGAAGGSFALRGRRHDFREPFQCRLAVRDERPWRRVAFGSRLVFEAVARRLVASVPAGQLMISLDHDEWRFGFRCKQDAKGLDVVNEPLR